VLREADRPPGRLHSNCSGKHAAMLARATAHGWSTTGYEHASHPVQDAAWRTVADWSRVPADEIARGVDGCGVTVFALPLHHMALAYARLAEAARHGDAIPARIVKAMTTHAHLVGGTDRFDTLLMTAGEGRIVAKVGAEGVHTVGLVDRGIGLAIKVEDGATRAQYPAVLACLQAIGALPAQLPAALRPVAHQQLVNTLGDTVGSVFVPGHELVIARDG
jgi:L-asparaginase II